ncbi:ATP-dependent RNA helicase DED1 [Lasiodiplodia theobromae]|uniref:ATP-dependent RNA helicase n=1 Tax=Lasiodiplodia theobromae TaxID=45133 RepID=A0A5N5DEF9_9PEZI|nr:ATP-dependent RNA helicase DED1 [Lasiodiplodia theobromae]
MDAAGDSERNDAASPSSPIPAGPHHAALNRQISGSKKSALTRTLDCDPDRNEFTIAMDCLHPEKFDSSTLPDSGTAGQTASQSRLWIEQEVAMIFGSLSPDLDSHLRHAEPIEPTNQLDDSVKASTPIPDTLAINFRITDTANPQEPESHDMITATVSAPSITSSCHVEPSLDEYTAPSCDNFHMRWLWDDPEDPVPYIESAPSQKTTAKDSSSGESALPEFFLQDLKCSLTKNLQDLGITGFTLIQADILRLIEKTIYNDADAVIFSSTNSGKSTAVLLGLIMDASIKNDKAAIAYRSPGDFAEVQRRSCRAPFAIIVCPTRDLAIDIFRRAWYLCHNTNVKPVLSIGGNGDLTVGDILIGTTGKLNRIAKDRMIGPAQYVVIEQASDMLQDSSRRILHRLLYENGAADCNTKFMCLFGGEDFVQNLRENYEKLIGSLTWGSPDSPRYITQRCQTRPFNGGQVHQHFFKVENHYMDLVSRLTKALHRNDKVKAVVFTKTTEDCDVLEDLLSHRIDDGLRKVRARGNNMSPRQREVNVESLRRGQCQILVTTGSLALGVKIVNVTHVIHFTLPRDEKKDESKLFAEYLQRIGMGGLSDHEITSWAYYDEKDERLFRFLAAHLVHSEQATSIEEVLEKFENGETIMPH